MVGASGVGKTRLAARYFSERSRTAAPLGLELLLWADAGSRHNVVSAYANAARELLGADISAPEEAAERFLVWSADPERKWVIVLDGVTDPAELTGLWPPAPPGGDCLLTSTRRDHGFHGDSHVVELDVFSDDMAVAFLRQTLGGPAGAEPDAELRELARDLGGLPLALAQAAAYITDFGLGCAAYRERFARRKLRQVLPGTSGPTAEYSAGIAAASLAVERADELAPVGLARPMLELISGLDGSGIPMELLLSEPARRYLGINSTHVKGRRSRIRALHQDGLRRKSAIEGKGHPSPEEANDALFCLRRLSLIDISEFESEDGSRLVTAHPLTRRAVRESMRRLYLGNLGMAASDILAAAWPETIDDPGELELFHSNAEAVIRNTYRSWRRLDEHELTRVYGDSLRHSGRPGAAVSHWRGVAARMERRGRPSPEGLRFAIGSLAEALIDAGRRDEAVAVLRQELAQKRRWLLSSRSPSRRWLCKLLCHALLESGKPEEALRLLSEDAASPFERSGKAPEDPLGMLERARAYRRLGDHETSIRLQEHLLDLYEKKFGPGHRETSLCRSSLADAYSEAGYNDSGVELQRRALHEHRELFGKHHQETLTTWNNLIGSLLTAGRHEEAAAEGEALLRVFEEEIDPDHPKALTVRNNLAGSYRDTGRPEEALRLYRRNLSETERILGPDAAEMPDHLHGVANAHKDLGDTAEQTAWRRRACEAAARINGPLHPDTIESEFLLVEELIGQGRRRTAARAAEGLPERLRRRGGDPEEYFAAVLYVGVLHESIDEIEKAEKLYRDTLSATPFRQRSEDSYQGIKARRDVMKTTLESPELRSYFFALWSGIPRGIDPIDYEPDTSALLHWAKEMDRALEEHLNLLAPQEGEPPPPASDPKVRDSWDRIIETWEADKAARWNVFAVPDHWLVKMQWRMMVLRLKSGDQKGFQEELDQLNRWFSLETIRGWETEEAIPKDPRWYSHWA